MTATTFFRGLACLGLVSSSVQAGEVHSTPLSPAAPSEIQGFTRVAAHDTGIDFQNDLKPENIRKYLYNGAGGCAGDYDGDGLTDLYLISQDGPNRLFRQVSPWQFEDVTESAGGLGGGEAWGSGACFVDVDNDGDLDLHVCNFGTADLFFTNQGDGTFVEDGAARGLALSDPTVMVSYSDYDRDGDLDCYLLTYRTHQLAETDPTIKLRLIDGVKTVHPDFAEEYRLIEGHMVEQGRPDRLLRNDGRGVFEDVTGATGLGEDLNHGLSAMWFDFNNDQWPDLYVASDFYDADRLWRNNGDGTFTDVLPSMTSSTPWFAMGSDFGDINRDGWFDCYVADMSAMNHYRQKMEMGEMGRSAWFLNYAEPRQLMRNSVFVNAGGTRFLESGFLSGLESTGWTWAVRFADLDCDGWEDAIVTNGMARDVNNSDLLVELKNLKAAGKLAERQARLDTYDKPGDDRNKVFRNLGDLHFEDVSETWGYNDMSASFGLILADLDRDGDLEAITNNMNQPLGVYRNDTSSGHRALIELRGRQSNHFGVGARLRMKSASGWQTRMLSLARGYESGDEPVIHFGLGEDAAIERLEIDWPSGARQVIEDLSVDHRHIITEPEGDFTPGPAIGAPEPDEDTLFSQAPLAGFEYIHREDDHNDYTGEPLLPWRMSRFGPGLAFGDHDGDGDEDLWIGGASGQPGGLMIREDDGSWRSGAWPLDAGSEDLGAAFIDPDGDGDLDLYVASGGTTATTVSRLYLNTDGAFAKATPSEDPEELAAEPSSGVVAAADYDGDGDVDVFIGSRTVTGKFHETPRQRLLRHEGDQLADRIDEISPALRDIGRVTSALWTDVDNDGRLDLMVTTAWGPVYFFRQQEDGKLVDATQDSGLAEAHGWWQGIDGGDLDGDGDIDYVVTNLGHNTKYHASAEHPFLLYARDFDGNGRYDLVEAEYEGDILYPARGLSCSSDAMPFIREQFPTYHEFASADLQSIYTPQKLQQALEFKFTNLDSSVLINDGEGHFEMRPLPPLAQIAPGFGVAVEDFDGDGKLDAVLAQNFFSAQPETGRMSGGLGVFLKGSGDGDFTEVWSHHSGIRLHGDAKSLAVGDLNDDGAPDLVCAINNAPVETLVNQRTGSDSPVRWSTIRLEGRNGNPTAIGSRLTIETSSGRTLVKEVRAGGGYLSQSTPQQFVALKPDEHVAQVQVRWPDGRSSTHPSTNYQRLLVLTEASGQALKDPEATPLASQEPRHYLADSTRQMAGRLRRHAASIDAFADIRSRTGERVEILQERILASTNAAERFSDQFSLGNQWLRGGAPETSLEQLLSVRKQWQEQRINLDVKSIRALEDLIVSAHLVRGEHDNCITRHNPDSCLLPIAGDGVHQSREGSEAAVAELTRMLDEDPSNLKARWLLNIAHMTLGGFPDDVPEPWLIKPGVLDSDEAFPRFVNRAAEWHIDKRGLAGGVVLDDFDGDGDIDILASAWGALDQIQLWANHGDGSFRDQTLAAGLAGVYGGLNLCQADFDNDGFVDVLVLRGAWFGENGKTPNSLLRNNGDGTFDDVTEAAGLLSFHPTQVAAWGDFDNDGWIDLFIGNESTTGHPHPCELFHNNGDGTFTEIAGQLRLDHTGFVKGAAWGDYDNDGDIDLYVSNFSQANALYRNDGDHFSDVTHLAGVAEPLPSFPT